MVAPIILLTDGCRLCATPSLSKGKANFSAKILITSFAFDMAALITTLVVGILGATSVLSLSPSVSYTLIGICGYLAFSYIVICLKGIYDSQRKSPYQRVY